MRVGARDSILCRLTWIALGASVVSLVLFVAMDEASSDTGLSIWFFLLVFLMFFSLPLHVLLLAGALIQVIEGRGREYRWIQLYLIVAVAGHLIAAGSYGAFEGLSRDFSHFRRSIEEPAQVLLEEAMRSGPTADIQGVREALAGGADPNAGIFENRLPFLVLASTRADTPAVEALLVAGANPNRRASMEFGSSFKVVLLNPSALDVLVTSEKPEIWPSLELLLAAGADPTTSAMRVGACRRGELPLYDLAMSLGAVGVEDARGQNCLHHAAATHQVGLIEALLSDPAYEGEGARDWLATSNEIGQYPLDTAIVEESFEAALIFLRAGGRANQEVTGTRIRASRSADPYLDDLKELFPVMKSASPPE